MMHDPTAPTAPSRTSWLGRSVLLVWLGYLLIAPTVGFNWIDSWHNEQRAVQTVLLAITAVAYLITGLVLPQSRQGRPWLPPAAIYLFLGIGVVSSIRTQFPLAALAEVSLMALIAILVLFTARSVATDVELHLRWARWFALLIATAYVLGVATRYLAAVNLNRPIDLDVFVFGYANPRFASALHAVLIPFLAMSVADRSELRMLRSASFAVLALLWAINLALGTRGIWFAYAVGVPITVALLGWTRTSRQVLSLVLSAAAGVVLYFLLFQTAPTVAGFGTAVSAPTNNLTLTSREVLWQLSWQAVKSAPMLGIGPMQFAALDSYVGAHPHNWALQIAAEWGLVALGVLLYGLFRLGRAIRAAREDDFGFVAITLAAAVAVALGMVDGNLVMPVSQTASALVFGLLLGSMYSNRTQTLTARLSRCNLMLASSIGPAAAAIVVMFAVTALPEQSQGASRFLRSHPNAWIVPRFWEQGLLYESRSNPREP